MQISLHRLGVVLALILGGWHLLWSAMVAIGWAQPLLDFIFWIHFLTPAYHVSGFQPVRALILVLLTSGIGYLFGVVGAFLWNRFHRPAPRSK